MTMTAPAAAGEILTLRQVRERFHISIQRLAARSEVGTTTIGRIERGENEGEPKFKTIRALELALRKLGVPIARGEIEIDWSNPRPSEASD